MGSKQTIPQGLIPMLKALEEVFADFEIDFYIVGAIARDYFLSGDPSLASIRKTDDVDIAVMLSSPKEFNDLKDALLATGDFAADEKEHIKLYYKGAIELDLLPFGGIEREDGRVYLEKPNAFTLNMPGFREIYPFLEEAETGEGNTLKICPVEGIVILKLLAYNDRPERTKDIEDIEQLIAAYFELCDADIYDRYFDVMSIYGLENPGYLKMVSARVIGRIMKGIIGGSKSLDAKIREILEKRNEDWAEAILDGLDDK